MLKEKECNEILDEIRKITWRYVINKQKTIHENKDATVMCSWGDLFCDLSEMVRKKSLILLKSKND